MHRIVSYRASNLHAYCRVAYAASDSHFVGMNETLHLRRVAFLDESTREAQIWLLLMVENKLKKKRGKGELGPSRTQTTESKTTRALPSE